MGRVRCEKSTTPCFSKGQLVGALISALAWVGVRAASSPIGERFGFAEPINIVISLTRGSASASSEGL